MNSKELYNQLEKDFITPQMSDDWAAYMGSIMDFLSDNFKERSMGLVCGFATEINQVYTAVFPSGDVLQKILDENVENAMLFVHHPSIWDIRQAPEIFQQMDRKFLEQFKKRKISIYNLHVPLDNYGEYSTSTSLAQALDIIPEKPFAPYFGALAGVFGRTRLTTVSELQKKFEEAVGHSVKLYHYGEEQILSQTVAVVAGGGLDETIEDVASAKVNVLVTGITARNNHSEKYHKFAEVNKINLLGGTHYSTEMFACVRMVDYFNKVGLPSKFIADAPIMEDM